MGVAKSGKQLLIASVGISTFGDKNNMDMARRFGFIPEGKDELESADMDKGFPKLMYFRPGDAEGAHYTDPVTKKAMLKFLDIEEKKCDMLTGEFCTAGEREHLKHWAGKTLQELEADLKQMTKRSASTLKKDERQLVDSQLPVLKKLVKAKKKAAKKAVA